MISGLKKKKRKRNQFMLPQIATVNDRIINSPSCQISRDQIDKKYLRWWILTKKWHPFKETILRPYTHKVSRISKSFSWTTTWELFPDSSLSLSLTTMQHGTNQTSVSFTMSKLILWKKNAFNTNGSDAHYAR